MTDVVYRIVEHDGGWAYKLDDVFSETFASRQAAETAANAVAAEQRVPGETEAISWQDREGTWHDENESGDDRPDAYVEGSAVKPSANTQGGSDRSTTAARPTGASREAMGAAGDKAFEATDRSIQHVKRGLDTTRSRVEAYPLSTILLAGAVGYVLAMVVHRPR